MARIKNRAVTEQRAPDEVAEDSPERKRWRSLDWYATPPFASRAGAEIVKGVDPGARFVWEPACGDGIMAKCLEPYFKMVMATDIEPNGYGEHCDFLLADPHPQCDWIITNPPFAHAQRFVELGLMHATSGVALLCRLAFWETTGRYNLHSRCLTDVFPFCERVPMQLGPWEPECSTATAFAWFIFHKARMDFIAERGTRGQLIPPGTQARLSLPDDIRNFCKPAAAPLLDAL